MTIWILAVLGLWVTQTMLPAGLWFLQAPDRDAATQDHIRGKDRPPERSVVGARAARALDNMKEAMPVFLTLALLLEFRGEPPALATQGAAVFFFGRALYVPAYMIALPGLRSLMWTVGATGLVMMVAALLQQGV